MTPADILADLAKRGIHLQAHGERLRYWPRSAVPPDLLASMAAHKAALLGVLRIRDALLPESGPAAQAEALDDWELLARLAALSPEGQALWAEQCWKRAQAGEPVDGLPWRALVDVRIARRGTPDAVPPGC